MAKAEDQTNSENGAGEEEPRDDLLEGDLAFLDEDAEDADSGKPAELSAEDQEDLRLLRSTGMRAADLLRHATSGRPNNSTASAKGGDNEKDDDEFVTREELTRQLREARAQSVLDQSAAQNAAQMTKVIDGLTTRVMGPEVPDFKLRSVQSEVAARIAAVPNFARLPERQMLQEIEKASKAVLRDEVNLARRIARGQDDAALSSRLSAAAEASNAGPAGGTSKRSAPAAEQNKPALKSPDRFGLGVTFMTDEEIDRATKDAVDERLNKLASGRA